MQERFGPFQHHLAICSRTGFLKKRSGLPRRAWAQVFREADARVLANHFLRDMSIPDIPFSDRRPILTLFHGVPVCCDATLVSAVHVSACSAHRSGVEPGAALAKARRRKEVTYPELLSGEHARLVILGC